MTTANLTSGSTGGHSIDFDAAARAPFSSSEVRVLKLCELCGCHFLARPMSRVRECESCQARLETEKEEAAKLLMRCGR